MRVWNLSMDGTAVEFSGALESLQAATLLQREFE